MLFSFSRLLIASLLFFSSCAPGSLPHEDHSPSIQWGVYQIYWNAESFLSGLDKQIAQLGTPGYVLFFRDLKRTFPQKALNALHRKGISAVISLELTIWGPFHRGDFLKAINQGEYDSFFTRWAKEAKDFTHPVYLRFGFEMNGDWFDWGKRPKEFTQAWKRVHRLMSQAENLHWVWAPNVIWGEMTIQADLDPYYPGSKYVDIVGLDGYNFGDKHDQWHRWQSFDEVFTPSLDALEKYKKPIWITEIGSADGKKKAAWLKDALLQLEKSSAEAFIYFNYDKRREGEPNWRIDSDSDTLKVFQEWVGSK